MRPAFDDDLGRIEPPARNIDDVGHDAETACTCHSDHSLLHLDRLRLNTRASANEHPVRGRQAVNATGCSRPRV